MSFAKAQSSEERTAFHKSLFSFILKVFLFSPPAVSHWANKMVQNLGSRAIASKEGALEFSGSKIGGWALYDCTYTLVLRRGVYL